uniref:Isochorismatase domain-containing protein n=1 Tax=Strongyloides venezuelensis TaxID=75913 RepID=A0A0K0FFZ4_STRVS
MLIGEPIKKDKINFNFENVRTMRLNSDLKALTNKMTNTNVMILGICETKCNIAVTFVLDDLYHCYTDKADKRIEGMRFIIIIINCSRSTKMEGSNFDPHKKFNY